MWVWEEVLDGDHSYDIGDWCRNLFLRLLIQACIVGVVVLFVLSCIEVRDAFTEDAPADQPTTQTCELSPTLY